MIIPNTFLSQLVRDCILLFHLPVDFLLTFTDPLDKVPALKEVTKDAHKLGNDLVNAMKSQLSGGMRVYFIGSSSFKIIGIDSDIDLLAEYTTEEEKKRWKNILTEQFGQPVVENHKFAKWETVRRGFPVEIVLSHAKSRIFQKIFDSYNALRTDPQVLAEYEELKRSSVGITLREYNRRQLYFFEYYVKNVLSSKKHANSSLNSSRVTL